MSEKEYLAIVYAVRTCRHYLAGEKFTVLTDHNALRWLIQITDPSRRLMRWQLRIAEFSFDVRYKNGSVNCCADFAPRMPKSNHIEQEDDDNDIPVYI